MFEILLKYTWIVLSTLSDKTVAHASPEHTPGKKHWREETLFWEESKNRIQNTV